jgi:hypothetical protein
MQTIKTTPQSEKTLRYVKMTMAMEGMPLTERDTADLCDCLSGKISAADRVKQLVAQYTVRETK